MTSGLSRRTLLGAVLGGAVLAGAGGVGLAVASTRSTRSGISVTGKAPFLAADAIHSLAFTVDQAAVTAALRSYRTTGVKDWIEATVVIDQATYRKAGIRLKGNSSLRSAAESTPAQSLPWLVRLDKYVPGTSHAGVTELVVRSSGTQTSLNEAVALDLLGTAGLATQQAAYVTLTVNGSAPALRLVIENPADAWAAKVFPTEGLLYKAEASGDWSYRGASEAAYDDVFDQESGKKDLAPLTGFLAFINNASDADFRTGLAARLDVAAFATYLAFEELIDNVDDIDGPGNNAYLWWARPTTRMTVVAWDHNLAFGSRPSAGGPGGAPGQDPAAQNQARPGQQGQPGPAPGAGQAPVPGQAAAQGQAQAPGVQRGGRGGPDGKANPLVTRFTTLLDGASRVAAAKTTLRQTLYGSGLAKQRLDTWATLVTREAAGLVDAATVAGERQSIEKYLT